VRYKESGVTSSVFFCVLVCVVQGEWCDHRHDLQIGVRARVCDLQGGVDQWSGETSIRSPG